jgi:acyl-CoA hydrolase
MGSRTGCIGSGDGMVAVAGIHSRRNAMDSVRTAPRSITLRFLAEPTDVNFGGKVHGGAVMKWIDQAGYACAVGWSGYYCVTVYIGGIRFYKPVFIGQIVEVAATLVHTGNSSMHIAVDVSATDPKTGVRKQTTCCLIVFVAVDTSGDTVPVPAWVPVTDEDKKLNRYAVNMAQLRKEQEQELSETGSSA